MRKGCETSSSPRPFLSFPFFLLRPSFSIFSPRGFFHREVSTRTTSSASLVSPFRSLPEAERGARWKWNRKMEARSYARGTVVEDRFGYPTFFLFFFQPTESLTKISFPIDSLFRGHREEIRVRARKGERETLALASPPIVCFFPESQTAALPACSCRNDD